MVLAEEATTQEQTDKLMLRGGWAYVFGANANVSVGGPVLGIGANVDLTSTLGVNTSTDAFRLMASTGSTNGMRSGCLIIGWG